MFLRARSLAVVAALTAAATGEEALRRLEAVAYDLVVADMRMPGMDGAALYEQICERWPAMERRVIFITGDLEGERTNRRLARGDVRFLEKPFAPEDLAVLHLDYQSSGLPIRKAEIDEFGVVTLTVRQRQRITYEPSFDESGKLVWECTTDIQQDLIPKSAHCRYDGLDFEGLGNLMR